LVGAGLGDFYGYPIPITPVDIRAFADLQLAQKSKDGSVLFKSDDPVQAFEVFMLTEKPKSYIDFARGNIRRIPALVADRPGQESDAISFVDTVIPNQKYYYIFRSVDIHGHISNPTPIYEVEVVDSDGAIYPLVKVYEPDIELPVDLSKQAQRLIQVRPEYLQSTVDSESSNLDGALSANESGGDIKLGIRDERLWDRRFKLRLTSCETRRTLDINLKFKTKYLQEDSSCSNPESTANDDPAENKGLRIPPNLPLRDLLTGIRSGGQPAPAGSASPGPGTAGGISPAGATPGAAMPGGGRGPAGPSPGAGGASPAGPSPGGGGGGGGRDGY
jgi:hypothetical protein